MNRDSGAREVGKADRCTIFALMAFLDGRLFLLNSWRSVWGGVVCSEPPALRAPQSYTTSRGSMVMMAQDSHPAVLPDMDHVSYW
jgi:hypothetical protein